MLAKNTPDQFLDTAIEAISRSDDWRSTLDALPVPTYTTDAEGRVTYWNQACVDFAGREPELGKDRWCVTWQLYTTAGDALPHDECPMATAIRKQEPVRGEVAIALRPDGSRRAFTPYPTPLFGSDGKFNGGINMLIDISAEQSEVLSAQAVRCRRLARATDDAQAADILGSMARTYDSTAASLRGVSQPAT